MDPIDEEKTSFISNRGTYCYKVMPFGIKNAGATYQTLVTKMFQKHLGKTMEVYIDDMLVKSQHSGDHISHLSDTFQILRRFNMKLNPKKCEFGVSSVNPAKIKAIKEIPNMLTNQFEWTEECQQALKNLKTYLSNPPLLAKSKVGERLLIYLAVSEVTVIAVLVREDQVTAYPLRNILHKHELSGRLAKWAIELSEYGITYPPRTAIKFQVLADFVGAGLGIVLVPPTGETIRQAIKCHSITNNEAEYEAVIEGLELARELGINQIVTKSDSHIVVNQVLGTYTTREARMQQYLEKYSIQIRMSKTSTGETPFSLVYRAESLIPVEIGEPSTRFTQASEECNDEEMWINLDLLEGRREAALIRMAAQKQVIERYYNRKARLRFFKIGDFMLKKVFQSTKAANAGKLIPTWEGPHRIHDIAGKRAYELEMMDGKILPSHWNTVHLKRYYF
ncbi:uncharacterized protein [Nicotiana sylvestris]|uniref:uncharacterized protein n=1 Tax=Nicotiana sylvestris TaxID=4096 RepID=UPI00388C731E